MGFGGRTRWSSAGGRGRIGSGLAAAAMAPTRRRLGRESQALRPEPGVKSHAARRSWVAQAVVRTAAVARVFVVPVVDLLGLAFEVARVVIPRLIVVVSRVVVRALGWRLGWRRCWPLFGLRFISLRLRDRCRAGLDAGRSSPRLAVARSVALVRSVAREPANGGLWLRADGSRRLNGWPVCVIAVTDR